MSPSRLEYNARLRFATAGDLAMTANGHDVSDEGYVICIGFCRENFAPADTKFMVDTEVNWRRNATKRGGAKGGGAGGTGGRPPQTFQRLT